MALQDYNQLIKQRLEEIRAAAEEGDRDRVHTVLETLGAEGGYDESAIAEPMENLDDLEAVVAWVNEQLDQMAGEENPFADASFDVDDAFLDVEDTGFRDIADDIDEDVDVLEGLDLDSSSAIELVDEIDDVGDDAAEDIDEFSDDEGFDLFAGLDDEESEDVDEAEASQAGAEKGAAEERPKKSTLLSGKFNVPDPKSLLSRKRDKGEKKKTLAEVAEEGVDESSSAQASSDADDDSDIRKTRPNVTPDFARKATKKTAESPFESGESKVRYAAGEEPPPPSHRLAATGDVSGEMAVSPPELDDDDDAGGDLRFGPPRDDATPFSPDYQSEDSEELAFDLGFENPEEKRVAAAEESSSAAADEPASDELEFDLGFENPEEKPVAAEASESSSAAGEESSDVEVDDDGWSFDDEDDDFDFDLGFENPEKKRQGTQQSSAAEQPPQPPSEAEEQSEASVSESSSAGEEEDGPRERLRTPMATEQDAMFFELAEALAAESSVEGPYRGEPKVPSQTAQTNPFAHDAPTGTAHSPLESVVAAAQSDIATNLKAILLEARRLRASGELEAALDITKKILSRSDSADAEALQKDIAAELEAAHIETLGSLEDTPELKVQMADIGGMDLDHRAGFILSQIDGLSSYADLIELSGMSRLETLGVLADLVEQDLIG